ncbi:pentapeptide repeat-containing protein [Nocardia sp. GCM10030253]|uniref:pentapeptide repeat-containing protein n=1 Tax=Nocardia sp. GCM10030253 TaxID=3273404 RepID=UPI00363B7169
MATTVATLGATITATGALWFTAQSLRATNSQHSLSQQTAVTDRFRLAAEQLASDKIDVRLSGIYLLERLAKDSPADHPTVFALLSAFLRTHTNASECRAQSPLQPIPADIQAVLTVITRRVLGPEGLADKLDLRLTCLAEGDLADVILSHADFTRANLTTVNLTRAFIPYANLTDADLTGAKLTDTVLGAANLTGAKLIGADLTGADLRNANLTRTDLARTTHDLTTQWPDGFTPP